METKESTAVTKAVATTDTQALTQPPTGLTVEVVRQQLCPNASVNEIELFIHVCAAEQLNPFLREIFLIKMSPGEAAAIVISEAAYLKAAESHPNYDGHEAGIILKTCIGLEYREGTFMDASEKSTLVGGYARVYRKDRSRPVYISVNLTEVRKVNKEGQPTKMWRTEPANMVRKVALHRALREAFPNRFSGKYSTTEMADGEFREAFTNSEGDTEWNKFWPKQFEKGVSQELVHEILRVESVKDWLDAGNTLEQADEAINAWLRRRQLEEGEPNGNEPGARGPETPTSSPCSPPAEPPATGPKGQPKPKVIKPVPPKTPEEQAALDATVKAAAEKAAANLGQRETGTELPPEQAKEQLKLRKELNKSLLARFHGVESDCKQWLEANFHTVTSEVMGLAELRTAIERSKEAAAGESEPTLF